MRKTPSPRMRCRRCWCCPWRYTRRPD